MTRRAVTLLALVLASAWGLAARAADPVIKAFTSRVDDQWISVSFAAGGVFAKPELKQHVDGGNPLVFTYRVKLSEERDPWPDNDLVEIELVREALLDPLTGRYQGVFRVDGAEQERVDLEKWDQMAEWLVNVPMTRVFPTKHMRGRKMIVMVRGHFFDDMKLFLPWDFETHWHKFTLPLPAAAPPAPPKAP